MYCYYFSRPEKEERLLSSSGIIHMISIISNVSIGFRGRVSESIGEMRMGDLPPKHEVVLVNELPKLQFLLLS